MVAVSNTPLNYCDLSSVLVTPFIGSIGPPGCVVLFVVHVHKENEHVVFLGKIRFEWRYKWRMEVFMRKEVKQDIAKCHTHEKDSRIPVGT